MVMIITSLLFMLLLVASSRDFNLAFLADSDAGLALKSEFEWCVGEAKIVPV